MPPGGGDNGEAEVDLGVSLHGSVCEPHSTIIALNARGSGCYFQDRGVGREGRETLAVAEDHIHDHQRLITNNIHAALHSAKYVQIEDTVAICPIGVLEALRREVEGRGSGAHHCLHNVRSETFIESAEMAGVEVGRPHCNVS